MKNTKIIVNGRLEIFDAFCIDYYDVIKLAFDSEQIAKVQQFNIPKCNFGYANIEYYYSYSRHSEKLTIDETIRVHEGMVFSVTFSTPVY